MIRHITQSNHCTLFLIFCITLFFLLSHFVRETRAQACSRQIDRGQAFSLGFGERGQLGLGDFTTRQQPSPVDTSGVLNGKRIAQVAAGQTHTMYRTADGLLYAAGDGRRGQLGNGDITTDQPSPVAVNLTALSGAAVSVIRTVSNHNLILDENGNAFCFGANDEGQCCDGGSEDVFWPKRVVLPDAPGMRITRVANGFDHTMVLTEDNQLFGCGANSGALGDATADRRRTPTPVIMTGILDGKRIIDIAAGFRTTFFLTDRGELYSTGLNQNGELCQGDRSPRTIPTQIGFLLEDQKILQIFAGFGNVMMLSDESRIFGCGRSERGQVGVVEEFRTYPYALDPKGTELEGHRVNFIGGQWDTTVLLTEEGDIFGIGGGDNLGALSRNEVNPYPIRIFSREEIQNKRVLSVAEGMGRHVVIVADNNCCPMGFFIDDDETCRSCPEGSYCQDPTQPPRACLKGTYGSGGFQSLCEHCPEGTYSSTTGSSECTQCEPGTYNDQEGQEMCSPCPIGSFSNEGSTQCTACPPGQQPTNNSDDCAQCLPGEFSSTNGTLCEICPAGTFSSEPGSAQCQQCPAGMSAPSGATSCDPCPPGSFSSEPGTTCRQCPAGTFSDAGASQCTQCPAGESSNVAASSCFPCNAGEFSPSSGGLCQPCPEGTFSDEPSSAECEECPAGQSSLSGSTSCKPCAPGQYSNATGSDCFSCPNGFFAPSPGSTECEMCPAGYDSPAASPTCQPCSPGNYNARPGGICSQCPDGNYAPVSGSSECFPCPVRQGSDADHTDCVLCPPGTFSSSRGGGCLRCPPGSVARIEGSFACLQCPRGSTSSDDQTECISCEAGFYNSRDGGVCLPCPPGNISTTAASSQCAACPAGYSSQGGSSSCFPCAPGSFTSQPGGVCELCPAGRFTPLTASLGCLPCIPGTGSEPGATVCSKCPSGSANPISGGTCNVCIPGTFAPAPGAILCEPCPVGTSSVSDRTTCAQCPPGTVSNAPGELCTPCPAGTFAPSSILCVPCPPGTYSAVNGSQNCLLCPLGAFNPIPQQTECRTCPEGTTTPLPGAVEADTCRDPDAEDIIRPPPEPDVLPDGSADWRAFVIAFLFSFLCLAIPLLLMAVARTFFTFWELHALMPKDTAQNAGTSAPAVSGGAQINNAQPTELDDRQGTNPLNIIDYPATL